MCYYDKKGNPITSEEWSELLNDKQESMVCQTKFSDGTFVSTVWLGLDHGMRGDGNPIIFETMVFTKTLPEWSDFMKRYNTEEEALHGHHEIIKIISDIIGMPIEIKTSDSIFYVKKSPCGI